MTADQLIELISSRTSASLKRMEAPGPSAEELKAIVEAAAARNVSTTLRQWHLDFKLDFLSLALVD